MSTGSGPGPTSGSPAARRTARPRWTDGRLLLGVLLVLGSVVVGSRVVAGAQRTEPVWAADRFLAPGTVLGPGDLRVAQVRLDAVAGRYWAVGATSPQGMTVTRPVSAGELVPAAALADPGSAGPHYLVSVPVEPLHFPPGLDRGSTVDVYVTPSAAAGGGAPGAAPVPDRVLADATVVAVGGADIGLGAAGGTVAVVLDVGDGAVPGLVGALRAGAVDLVLVTQR